MAVQRGFVYDYRDRAPANVGLLVLTNDLWNQGMIEVGVVPVTASSGVEELLAPILRTSPGLRAWPGRLAVVEQQRLSGALFKMTEDNLALVEDALCQILSLGDLCSQTPKQPLSPPGLVDYLRWSEVYYGKTRIGNEHKRYVVASNDGWNKTTQTAIVVRTTTQPARHAPGFPLIQRGAAKACCGNAAAVPTGALVTRREDRPQPSHLQFQDMVTIAREIVATHQLEAALARSGVPLP